MNAEITEAKAAMDLAAQKLAEAVKKEYPVGCPVEASVGKNRVKGRVDGYGYWEADPAAISVENAKSGKRRKFSVVQERNAIVKISEESLAAAKAAAPAPASPAPVDTSPV